MKHILYILRIETLYRAYIKCIQWLQIAPERKKRVSFLCYIKTCVIFIVTTLIFLNTFRFRYVYYSYELSGDAFQECIQHLAEGISYIGMMLTFWSYLKNATWQRLDRRLEILGLPKGKDIEYDRGIAILLIIFFVCAFALLLLIYPTIQKFDQKAQSLFNASTIVIGLWVRAHYSLSTLILILILTFNVRSQVKKATEYLKENYTNIKMSKLMFLKACSTIRLVNMIFGYSLLAIFAHSMVSTIALGLGMVIKIKYNQNPSDETFWNLVISGGIRVVISAFGPCAIAFASEMVTTETEKLLTKCCELQQKLDYRSSNYQQLESFQCYIISNGIRFTAADFFEIKRSTILSVVATSTTYFVALVQFY